MILKIFWTFWLNLLPDLLPIDIGLHTVLREKEFSPSTHVTNTNLYA